jgi:AcrR family transcriptional regulator
MPRIARRKPVELAHSAFELFAERGFNEVTVDGIAARAGVTKGSFYSHYASKREVILAACHHYYRTYQQRVHSEIAALTNPLERLQRVVEFSVTTCIVDGRSRLFTAEVFSLALRDDEVRNGWAQFYDSVREMYVGLVVAARKARQIRVVNPRQVVDLMLAAIEGIKQRAAFEPQVLDDCERESMVEGLMQILGAPCPEPARVS